MTIKNKTSIIDNIKNAYDSMDIHKAIELIQKPQQIEPLLNLDPKQEEKKKIKVRCSIAMHAIVIPLFNTSCQDVLNQMTDKEIAELKKCISIAKKHQNPNLASINRVLEERRSPEQPNYTDTETNEIMTTSLELQSKIIHNNDWNSATKELDRWSDAIDTFVRGQQKPKIEILKDNGFITIKELARRLNISELVIRKYIEKRRAKNDIQITKMFEMSNRNILFNENFFAEFKTTYETRNTKRGRPKQKNTPVVNKPKPVTKTESLEKQEKQPIIKQAKQKKTLLDIKALSAYINKLVEMLKVATQELDTAKAKSQELRNTLASEQDEKNVTNLLSQVIHANTEVQKKKENLNAITEKYNAAQKLLQEYNEAEKRFNAVQNEIAAFMNVAQNQHQ